MTTNTQQLTREDLRGMSLEEVGRAHAAGQLDDLLGVPRSDVPDGQLTREHLASMTDAQIVEAQANGQLDELLAGTDIAEAKANAHRLGDIRSVS